MRFPYLRGHRLMPLIAITLCLVLRPVSAQTNHLPADPDRSKTQGALSGKKGGNPPADKATDERASANGKSGKQAGGASEMERYEGRLTASDTAFTLRLMHDGSATADWLTSPDSKAHFTGTYTGQDGNYVVNLTKSDGTNRLNARSLTLYLHGMGGMVDGQFSTDTYSAKRDIADLKLTSVDAGNIRLHGTKRVSNPMKTGRRSDGFRRRGRRYYGGFRNRVRRL